MKLGRLAFAGLALGACLFTAPRAEAGNGSNYVHLTNGIDYFFLTAPTVPGTIRGQWRCFPDTMLHAPTKSITGTLAGTYSTQICALHINVTASAGPNTISFPTIALSSSAGKCNFLTSAGGVNYGLFSVAGFGTIIAGPLTGNQGPVTVNLLAGLAGFTATSPSTAPNQIIQIVFNLAGLFGQTIDVPEGEALVMWVQDKTGQTGAGTRQYWTGSGDERNLCSSYSFLFSGATGFAFTLVKNFEWGFGFGTLDATMQAAITSLGGGPSGLNPHDSSQGFNPGFDQGAGSRTISITGTGGNGIGSANLGSEFLGFNIYDEQGGSRCFNLVNAMGVDLLPGGGSGCNTRAATFFPLPAGGPAVTPTLVLSNAIPEAPRSVGKFDALANLLLGQGFWILTNNHGKIAGGNNQPYFPAAAAHGGSNAGGNVGGAVINPIPQLPTLPGIQLFAWSFNVDPTNSFLFFTENAGHSNTNGYDFLFFP